MSNRTDDVSQRETAQFQLFGAKLTSLVAGITHTVAWGLLSFQFG